MLSLAGATWDLDTMCIRSPSPAPPFAPPPPSAPRPLSVHSPSAPPGPPGIHALSLGHIGLLHPTWDRGRLPC